jgi:nucleoid DNA-binding protein
LLRHRRGIGRRRQPIPGRNHAVLGGPLHRNRQTLTPVKPVKQTLTKSALINLIAEENEIPRKTAAGVYATLENLFFGSVHPRGVGEFVLPGLLKVNLRKIPARKAGALVRNPATGEMVKAAAKPASVRVKIRALSKLKTAAGP